MQKVSKHRVLSGFFVVLVAVSLFSCYMEGSFLKSALNFDFKSLVVRWFTGGPTYDVGVLANRGHKNVVPALIIGSGPAALGSALYTGRANWRTIVLEGDLPGGQLMRTGMVENWGSVKKDGPDLIMREREHVEEFGAEFVADTVDRVDLAQWPFEVHTVTGKTYYALTLIIATGASSRKLGVPGEEQYWGHGVTPCAKCDKLFFRDADVVVVGGGDTAVEEATQLAPYARRVTILVRGERMRAAASMQDRLKTYSNIAVEYNVEVKEVLGNGQHVTGITVYNNVTKEQAERPMDGVFLAIGHLPNTSLFKGQLELTKEGYIVVKGRGQETSVRGVFAAGDVEDEWYHQAIVAQGRGSAAGLDAERFLSEIGLTEEIAASFNKAQPDKEIQDAVEVQKITKAKQFKQEVLNSSMPVVVDFYTPPCASCRAMMPVFESLAASYEGKLKFVKVDADELQSIAKEYAIYSVPWKFWHNSSRR